MKKNKKKSKLRKEIERHPDDVAIIAIITLFTLTVIWKLWTGP